ncbi:hypothetical protein IF2G_05416 [Cordyceps javanica]|nr:hypothetical protein IF2G_05416 [Cordyceps javanica]
MRPWYGTKRSHHQTLHHWDAQGEKRITMVDVYHRCGTMHRQTAQLIPSPGLLRDILDQHHRPFVRTIVNKRVPFIFTLSFDLLTALAALQYPPCNYSYCASSALKRTNSIASIASFPDPTWRYGGSPRRWLQMHDSKWRRRS